MLRFFEITGRGAVQSLNEAGYAGSLLGQSVFWTFLGRRWRQPVRLTAVLEEIRAAVEDSEDEGSGEHESLLERLNEATRHFEESHPTLTAMVGRVAESLSNLGI